MLSASDPGPEDSVLYKVLKEILIIESAFSHYKNGMRPLYASSLCGREKCSLGKKKQPLPASRPHFSPYPASTLSLFTFQFKKHQGLTHSFQFSIFNFQFNNYFPSITTKRFVAMPAGVWMATTYTPFANPLTSNVVVRPSSSCSNTACPARSYTTTRLSL